ncbi:hypothetical protein ACFX2J_003186 [Malus domestica]
MPPSAPIQQNFGSGSYGQTSHGGAYHYQGDAAPYAFGQNQYSQDPYFQTRYSQDLGGQPRQGKVAASSAGPFRQSSQTGQERTSQGGEVIKVIEVMEDDNKLMDVLITSHCKILKIIQT